MIVIDHTDPTWSAKCTRTNGALTYSQDLVKYQIPLWEKILGPDDIISTCPKFSTVDIKGQYNIAIQYLHSYPYGNPVNGISKILWDKPFKANRVIFITAYKEFEKKLREAGIEAVYVPMAIDVNSFAKYNEPKLDYRVLYFGNITHYKLGLYNRIKINCRLMNIPLDTLSLSQFNKGPVLSREEVLKTASRYKHAIAVGRAAQELNAMGIKTMIAGYKLGGLITSKYDYKEQLKTNMNGRIWTYSDNLKICLRDRDKSVIYHNDITKLNHPEIVREEYKLY